VTLTDSPTQLKIGNKSYDNAAAQKIADFLNTLDGNIEVADISDIIAGRPEDEALRTLSILSEGLKRFQLKELNVSDNAMGAKGVEACREILRIKSLQVL
jgi:Ran GTPase-activating protein (RanGAP) involved in mRNA processing and transport